MKQFKGLGVALVTPFTSTLEVDFDAIQSILEHLYSKNAVDYLVVLGSTGEAATLTLSEKQAILSFVNEFNNDRLSLVLGHGGNDTNYLVQSLASLDLSGYSAILSSSPAYVKPTQQGIIAHYQKLADMSKLPILLYNVPSRTSSNIDVGSIELLSNHTNIIGIKEASGDLLQAMAINAVTSDEFLLISGDDMLTVPLFSVGACGLISVLGNAYPEIYKEIIASCKAGNYKKAVNTAINTRAINELMYEEGNPVGIKQLLAHLGLCQAYVRLPLVPASAKLSDAIKTSML